MYSVKRKNWWAGTGPVTHSEVPRHRLLFGKEIVRNKCNKWSENPQGYLAAGK